MHHLTLEELARLVDEAPTVDERAHLDRCERCGSELDSLIVQTGMLGQLPDPVLPQPLHWRIREALVTQPQVPAAYDGGSQTLLRAAAAIALFLFGGAVGTFAVAPRIASVRAEVAATQATAADPAEAAASLAAAEEEYLKALSEFAEYNYPTDGLDPLDRLAALEGIVLTTRAALREAPADPVINNYHLTALGQRDALLRHLQLASDTLEWF